MRRGLMRLTRRDEEERAVVKEKGKGKRSATREERKANSKGSNCQNRLL